MKKNKIKKYNSFHQNNYYDLKRREKEIEREKKRRM
jgi:hypothetical protein